MSKSNEELKRIANSLEEIELVMISILRMVKEDQERTKKYMEKESE
jgi:hypothetical protein